MARFIALLILAASLSACVDGSNPFDEETTDETATTETETEKRRHRETKTEKLRNRETKKHVLSKPLTL